MILAMHTPFFFFFFNDTATTEIYTLSLHDALPISDGEEGHDEKDHAESVRLAHRSADLGRGRRLRAEGKQQDRDESQHVADDEFRETLPDLADLRLVARRTNLDMVGPDISEDKGPDADEDVDEDLPRGGGPEYPAFRVVDALGRVGGENQRFGDRAARHGRAIGLHREPHPRAGHHGFMSEESIF